MQFRNWAMDPWRRGKMIPLRRISTIGTHEYVGPAPGGSVSVQLQPEGSRRYAIVALSLDEARDLRDQLADRITFLEQLADRHDPDQLLLPNMKGPGR